MLLSRYAKSIDFLHSPYLGIDIDIQCKGMLKDSHWLFPANLDAKIHQDLIRDLVIPEGKICAITSDLSKVYGVYAPIYAAAASLGM